MIVVSRFAGVVWLAGFAGPAWAAPAPAPAALGTYTGSAADGSFFSFNVTEDTSTNVPAITGVTYYFTAACPSPYANISYGMAFPAKADIVTDRASYASGYPNSTVIRLTFVFDSAANTVTGTSGVALASLVNSARLPTRAYVCTSARQSFTASLQTGTASALPVGVGSYEFDRRGRVIGAVSSPGGPVPRTGQ